LVIVIITSDLLANYTGVPKRDYTNLSHICPLSTQLLPDLEYM